MDNSHRQIEILFLPLSSAVAAIFPRQSGFRGRTPLLCLLIHGRLDTWTQTQLHIVWIWFEDCIKVHAQQYLQQVSACPGHLVKGVRRSSRCGLEWRYNGEVRCTMEQRLRHLRTFLVPCRGRQVRPVKQHCDAAPPHLTLTTWRAGDLLDALF